MSQRWGIRFAIEGDLRFLSHHDMMRTAERTARRSDLPLHYSQGYNPRPVLSLACPRPVGVASRDELLVLVLDEDVAERDLRSRLEASSPLGMRVLEARPLEGKPRVVSQEFQLSLREEIGRASCRERV